MNSTVFVDQDKSKDAETRSIEFIGMYIFGWTLRRVLKRTTYLVLEKL